MEFDVSPYYDDFETSGGARDENYMRILFRPGYAVQARELTQLQTIIQNQIKQFGNHIFKDGSPVTGGQLTFNNDVVSISLQASDDIFLQDFDQNQIINSIGETTKSAYVIAVDDSIESSTVSGALMIKYTSGDQFENNDQIEVLSQPTITGTLLAANSTTKGSIVSINEGVFYVGGFFVHVPEQTIVLDSANRFPSYRIGLETEEDIVDETQDTNLLDPAQESFNYQAPGGTRYKFYLSLSKRTLDSTDDSNFFELLRIEDGIITKQVNYPIYSELNKTLARRTYDESGDYTVKPFRVTVSEDAANASNVILNIDPGKAYVKGYEYETVGLTKLPIPKARSTSVSTDYDLSLEFGNYIVATNVSSGNSGIFDIETLPVFDIHLVPVAQINTKNATAYTRTTMGTAVVRDIEYVGGGDYYIYLTRTNMNPFQLVNAVATSSNTRSIVFPNTMPSVTNSYSGVEVAVLYGTNAGEKRKIVEYDGPTRTGFVDYDFSVACDTSTQMTFTFSIDDAQSIAVRPTVNIANVALESCYYAQNANTGFYPAADISPRGKDVNGRTVVYGTDRNYYVFKLPESYVVKGNTTNVGFKRRKVITGVASSGNTITLSYPGALSSDEKFVYGLTDSVVSSVLSNDTCFLAVRDKASSNLANGQILTFSEGGNRIYSNSANQITIFTTANSAFTADIIITVEVSDAESFSTRTKTLRGNSANTELLATDHPDNALTVVSNTANVKIDTTNGHVWFINSNNISLDCLKSPGLAQPLYIPDVISITSIYASGNDAYYPNSVNAIDVTNRYLFWSGQGDNFYNHATLTLKPGAQPPTGQVVVMLEYFEHSATKGYFSVDSYSSDVINANKVPTFVSFRGDVFPLRDCVDFRPTRLFGDAYGYIFVPGSFVLSYGEIVTGTKVPYPYYTMTIGQYEFYLPRIDKLLLTTEGDFKVLEGTPSNYPTIPADPTNAMALYNITIPPYTANAKDVLLDYIDNRRYTMRDIGQLKRRIENLEYYTSLSLLEVQSTNQSILYRDGSEKEKYGIVADNFGGFDVADNRSTDLICNISDRELSPYKIIEEVEFEFKEAVGQYKNNLKTFSQNYTEVECVVQNNASKSVTVQPYQFAEYFGTTILTPETDFWYSRTLAPERIVPANNPSARETSPVEVPQNLLSGSTTSAGENLNITPTTETTTWLGSISLVDFGHTLNFAGFGSINIDEQWLAQVQQTIEDSSSQTQSAQTPTNSGAAISLPAGGSFIGGTSRTAINKV